MPSNNIHYNDLKPKTPGANLLMLHLNVEHNFTGLEVERYLAMYKMINTVGYHAQQRVPGFPNPFGIKTWEDVEWRSGPAATTTCTFAEVTNMRAIGVARMLAVTDLPLVVSYSGGIDSTVIVAAIVKNFPKDLLERVIIKMNNASYFENPYFYNNVIKKYGLQVTDKLEHDWDNSIIVAGEPGDSVALPFVLPELDRIHPGSYKRNPVTDPDILIEWLAESSTLDHAEWYHRTVLNSAALSDFEMETYEDFFWWAKQALAYGGNVLNLMKQRANPWHERSWERYKRNTVAWYHTSLYRRWSSSNRNNGVKYDGTLRGFKMPMKSYIYGVDKNPYYLNYKTKTFSSGFPERGRLAALYDDGTAYFFPDQIYERRSLPE